MGMCVVVIIVRYMNGSLKRCWVVARGQPYKFLIRLFSLRGTFFHDVIPTILHIGFLRATCRYMISPPYFQLDFCPRGTSYLHLQMSIKEMFWVSYLTPLFDSSLIILFNLYNFSFQFNSAMDSNQGSSSNSELKDQWEDQRRQLIEEDEEHDTGRHKNYLMTTTTTSWVCKETSQQPQWGDFIVGHVIKPRQQEIARKTLMKNYFNPHLVYTEDDFRCRFWMRRHVFERLLSDVQAANPFF